MKKNLLPASVETYYNYSCSYMPYLSFLLTNCTNLAKINAIICVLQGIPPI